MANLCEFSAPYNAKKELRMNTSNNVFLRQKSLFVEVRNDKRPGRARTKRWKPKKSVCCMTRSSQFNDDQCESDKHS